MIRAFESKTNLFGSAQRAYLGEMEKREEATVKAELGRPSRSTLWKNKIEKQINLSRNKWQLDIRKVDRKQNEKNCVPEFHRNVYNYSNGKYAKKIGGMMKLKGWR